MKKAAREEAIHLRKAGYSYNLIAEKVNVSKSTLSLWLTEVPYQPNEIVMKRLGNARAAVSLSKHKQKIANLEKARQLAQEDVGQSTDRDLFMFGLAIYLGEGEKNSNVGVINANSKIIVTTMRWLERFYQVPKSSFTLAIHLYPDSKIRDSLEYWSKQTGIHIKQFGKTQIDRRPNKRSGKRRKLPHGTAHLRVRASGNKNHGVLLSRRIQAAADIVLEQNR